MIGDELKNSLKENIIKYVNLMDVTPQDIENDKPLFGEDGLGLDSIDSIELIVMMEREYGVKVTDPKMGRKVMETINTMAEYIEANQEK